MIKSGLYHPVMLLNLCFPRFTRIITEQPKLKNTCLYYSSFHLLYQRFLMILFCFRTIPGPFIALVCKNEWLYTNLQEIQCQNLDKVTGNGDNDTDKAKESE